MPTRPSTPYRWGTNAGARVAPSLARQGTGWVMNEPIDPLQCNDIWGQLSDWVDYLADVIPASNVITAEVFRVVDPAGPTNRGALTWDNIGGNDGLVVGSTEGDEPGFFFDSVTGYVIARQNAGVDLLEIRPKGLLGPRALPDADGVRFGFDSTAKLQLVHDVSPQSRAYMVHMVTLAATPCVMVFGAGNVALYNGDATTAQQAVFRSQIALPIEAGQTTRFPVIKKLEATFTGAADDLEIAVIRITKSTGAETSLGLIKASAAANTFGGGSTTDPLTYTYALEVRSPAALAVGALTVDGVRNVLLTIDWMTLNPFP